MADIARIKGNVRKMVAQNAPEADIDAYIASEGVTLDQVRSAGRGHNVPEFKPVGVDNYNPETGMVETKHGKAGSAFLGAMDGLSFGFADEGAGALDALISGQPYSRGVQNIRNMMDDAKAQNPVSYGAGQVVGSVAPVVAAGPATLTAGAIRQGAGLGRVALSSALDGAAIGAATGAGAGETTKDRLKQAILGGSIGGITGGAAPVAMAGAGAVVSPFVSGITSRLRPQTYANRALGDTLQRSGQSADDVATSLLAARADGQDMFTVADALGNSGQRLLSTVTRTPNEASQQVADTLLSRQAGQGRRITNALSEGFAAPDTAAQRTTALTRARDAAADAQFGAARQNAGPVDVTDTLAQIDQTLRPGVSGMMNPGNNIANDTVEQSLARARSLLSDGQSNSVDFNAVYRARQDIADWAQAARQGGAGNKARELGGVLRQLDAALERSSTGYQAAMNNFRDSSRAIEAVDVGRAAAQRGRSQDTIPAFNAMPAEQQAAFRAGYADPLIAQVEGAATGVNKARPLINDATAAEFPAFAAQGQGDRLGRRIGREQTMFETQARALGGSRTADNLADMADASRNTPEVLMNAARGGVGGMVMSALAQVINEGRGLPPSVLTSVGNALMETNPEAARQLLRAASNRTATDGQRRAIANAILNGIGSSTAGRLTAP